MKKAILTVLALMVTLVLPSTLCAQSEGTWFKVPFAFVVADKQMPAGQYHVESLYWNAVAIQRSGGDTGVIAQCQRTAVPAGDEPKLIFRKYGSHYFLTEVRLLNMDSGRQFYKSREEIEVAARIPKPEAVEVAAK